MGHTAEKWTSYADTRTGINPFLHDMSQKPRNALDKMIQYSLMLSILPARLMVRWSFFMYKKQSTFFSKLLPARASRPILWALHTLVLRVYLALFGFYYIDARSVGKPKASIVDRIAPDVEPGDLIIANRISWTQILYLTFRFNPIYAFPATDYTEVPATVPVKAVDFSEAVKLMSNNSPIETKHCKPLSDVIYQSRQKGRCVVLFPEGCSTNGKGLLKFLPVLDSNITAVTPKRVLTMAFKIKDTKGLAWINTGFEKRSLGDRMTAESVAVQSMTVKAIETLPVLTVDGQWWADTRKVLAQSIQVPCMDLTVLDRKEFFKAYHS
ncbi:1-acyl-sn-glycerol-3-phosphate acyltransferase [Carpediemonas membranifera]|uniref:1-acyl-sn-glycerol-3-phosphate acyltransferase n=1 Tax=Carpediemonas membranifera TaxID=201153 RepID=A0A8J6ASP4_9EUKA|nr:1-acyl-sn-glycerol-3-phosphate acyltransferase [Carpediemonas membranifera]|eukprot:KAG9393103.1 1-acyl-sn-glycerol-3-phosphate acyltransferase [Carpediemonas membranifera]